MTPTIRIQREDFSTADEIAALTRERSDVGAVVTFTGLCRNEAGRLAALEPAHYPSIAQAEIRRVAGTVERLTPALTQPPRARRALRRRPGAGARPRARARCRGRGPRAGAPCRARLPSSRPRCRRRRCRRSS